MKAQGLSLTAIIVAALALIVLVVLAAIFTGQIGGTAQTLRKCSVQGGQCLPKCNDDYPTKMPGTFTHDVAGQDCTVCCLPIQTK